MKITKKEHIEWLLSLGGEVCPGFPSVWHVAVYKYHGNPKYYATCAVKGGIAIRRGGKLYLLAE